MDLRDQLFEQCKTAISVYNAHTKNNILDNVSDSALKDLAVDATISKYHLREMLRKHPNWDENTQSVILKTTVSRVPNPHRVVDFWHCVFNCTSLGTVINAQGYDVIDVLYDIDNWLSEPDSPVTNRMKKLMDWHSGQKKNRLIRKLLVSMGVWDDKDSELQRYFAQLSDELKSGEREINLILSINPAHFLTMSNPKACTEGDMLTSCHSLNSKDYPYNNGCTGYARDYVTMIAFTVANLKDADSWFYRKTSRQLFMYKHGSGVLLQSRMYNTEGGLSGTDENTKVYRNLVQDCICECEGAHNYWRTCPYIDNRYNIEFSTNHDFGGYADWEYEEFCAKVSVRNDWDESNNRFSVGKAGICLCCGYSLIEGVFCQSCVSANEEDF